MPLPFSRTLRALERDDARRPLGLVLVGATLVLAWLGWLSLSRVAVYAESVSARIEAGAEAHRVEVETDGRVAAVAVSVGQRVEAGTVLLELEQVEVAARVREARANLEALELQHKALRSRLATESEAVGTARAAETSALEEARASLAEAVAVATLAREEADRLTELADAGAVPPAELSRALGKADEKEAAEEAAGRRLEVLRLDRRAGGSDRESRRSDVERELAVLDARIASAAAEVTRAEEGLRRTRVVAPVSGVVGELASLQPGSVVRRGEVVGWVVPHGALEVVARFRPSDAVGRVAVGQSAWVRLEGFSWTEYGSVRATVQEVPTEAVDGRIRVQLTLDDQDTAIPLQHGLPGTVDVEVERVSPLTLLFRVAGNRLTGDGA